MAPEELVVVEIAPGRWQKMTRKQAADAGYEVPGAEPEAKTRQPANKARKVAPRKATSTRKTTRRS